MYTNEMLKKSEISPSIKINVFDHERNNEVLDQRD